ncbi:MAG: phospholipid carrier-dependent glycosyltransferase [Caldilineaceae bacterium]
MIMLRHRRQLLFVCGMALLFWLPRGLGLDRFATADENAWLTRSANVYWALSHGDWAGTFQRHHPGVTLTWAGTLGFLSTYPNYVQETDRDFDALTESLTPFVRAQGHEPIDLLAAGRMFVVIFIVLALTLSFVFAWRAWGVWPALAGGLLLAFDPFHIAHSRLMHLDGLLSSFMLLAVAALFVAFNWAEERSWQWGALITAGVATGLAWLTPRHRDFFCCPLPA